MWGANRVYYGQLENSQYGHLVITATFVGPPVKNRHTFSLKKKPLFIRPNFFGPLVTVLTVQELYNYTIVQELYWTVFICLFFRYFHTITEGFCAATKTIPDC